MLFNRLTLPRFLFSFTKKAAAPKQQSTFEKFASDIKNNKDVYTEYQKQVEQDSILKKFRRQVFKKDELSEQLKSYQEEMEMQQRAMNDLLNRGSKEEMIKYSKKVMEKMLNKKKVFKDQTVNPVFSDYGDYSTYRSNYLKVQDGNLGNLEMLDQQKNTQLLYQFIDKLPDDYEQKDAIREKIQEDFHYSNDKISIADYGKILQKRVDVQQWSSEKKQYLYENYLDGRMRQFHNSNQFLEEYIGKQHTRDDLTNQSPFPVGRLSPQAIDTIYDCYLQGWTVRDISKRFGILPARTKFYIWARAQLYDEILPKYGWKYYYEAMKTQAQWGEEFGYIDYGLDLHIMQADKAPQEIIEWNYNRVDAQRKEEQYTYALQTLSKMQKFDRHQKLEVGTHGKENKMYLLKEWTIFRGKGSDHYHLRNKTFRQLSKAHKKMVKEYY